MKQYRVTLTGESRETYIVDAQSEDEARENWESGCLETAERFGMEVDSVDLDYTDEDEA